MFLSDGKIYKLAIIKPDAQNITIMIERMAIIMDNSMNVNARKIYVTIFSAEGGNDVINCSDTSAVTTYDNCRIV